MEGLGDLVKAEAMVQIALAVPADALSVGFSKLHLLDKHFHTEWMTVVGIALGAVAGFIQIYRVASDYLKRSGE